MDDSAQLRNDELPGNDTGQRNENRGPQLERKLEELVLRDVGEGIEGGTEGQAAKQSSCEESIEERVKKVGEVQGEQFVNRLLDKATTEQFSKTWPDAVLNISRTEREMLQQAANFHPQTAKVLDNHGISGDTFTLPCAVIGSERRKKAAALSEETQTEAKAMADNLQISKENKNEEIRSESFVCKLDTERMKGAAHEEELKSESRVVRQATKPSRPEDAEFITEFSKAVMDGFHKELHAQIEATDKYANRSMSPQDGFLWDFARETLAELEGQTSTEDKEGTLEIHQEMLRNLESYPYGHEQEAAFLKLKKNSPKRESNPQVAGCVEELQLEAEAVQKNVNHLMKLQLNLEFDRQTLAKLEGQNYIETKEDAQEIRRRILLYIENYYEGHGLHLEDSPKQASNSQATSCDKNSNPEPGKETGIADTSKEGASNEVVDKE